MEWTYGPGRSCSDSKTMRLDLEGSCLVMIPGLYPVSAQRKRVGFGAIRRRSYTPEERERPWMMLERRVAL
jgi:hypothetical protein